MWKSVVRYGLVWMAVTTVAVNLAVCLLFLMPFRAHRIRLTSRCAYWLAPVLLRILGVRVKTADRQRILSHQPAIYVANHSSALDTILIPWTGPPSACFVLKKSALLLPVFGQIVWLAGYLLIDRKKGRSAVRDLETLNHLVVEHGLSVWIMPEGTRSRDGQLGRFKRGFVRVALHTGLPIVPIVFHGAADAWPNGTWRLTGGSVEVEVLDPVDTSKWSSERTHEHANEIRERIRAALDRPVIVRQP